MNNDLFSELRELNLEGNNIPLWEEINKLGNLPKYDFIMLLSEVDADDDELIIHFF